MADLGKWRWASFCSVVKHDLTNPKEDCQHPELEVNNKVYFYDKFNENNKIDENGKLQARYLTQGWRQPELYAKLISERRRKRLSEVYVYGKETSDRVDVVSLVCHVPLNVKPEDQEKFMLGFRLWCQEKFGMENMLCVAEHWHENRPHSQAYFLPVVFDKKHNREKLCAKDLLRRRLYQSLHLELQEHMDKYMGYHVEVELNNDNPKKKKRTQSINSLKDNTNKAKIKELKNEVKELESERNFFRRELASKEAIYNCLRRVNPEALRQAGKEMSDSDKVDESILNTRYELYHNQRVEAGRKRKNRSKER